MISIVPFFVYKTSMVPFAEMNSNGKGLDEEYVTSYDDVTQILIKVGTIDASKQIYC